jgi:hypothetical protein
VIGLHSLVASKKQKLVSDRQFVLAAQRFAQVHCPTMQVSRSHSQATYNDCHLGCRIDY